MNKKQLLELKEEIDKAKTEISHMEGQKKAIEEQLFAKTKSISLKQVKEKLQAKRDRLEILTGKIEKNLELIEEKYFKN